MPTPGEYSLRGTPRPGVLPTPGEYPLRGTPRPGVLPAPGYAPALGTGHTEEVNRFDDVLATPPPLPVVDALPRLSDAVRPGQALVLSAPPGSGKTTHLPLLLASATPAQVLVTQPRRIAVRAAARRLASLLGTRLGEEIGYTVRGERIVGPETRIEVMTPGVLLRRLQADPSLEGVSAVMLDEFHERAIDTDLALAFLLDVRAVMREDLHLSLTSATLEAERTARLLSTAIDEVETLSVPGALHPLELHYAPARSGALNANGNGRISVNRDFLAHVARTVEEALHSAAGDVLVFLPGARQIDELASFLGGFGLHLIGGEQVEVLPLHASLPSTAQDRVMSGAEQGRPRRIIVSTAVAESSLTVPGVRIVVDAGLSREARLDAARRASGLVTVSASKAQLEQRSGRAARLGPGLAIRCMSEVDFARRTAQPLPEIATADLTDAALQALVWDSRGLDGLRLLDAAPRAALDSAVTTLRILGLVDSAGVVTPLGRSTAALPLDPALGAALLSLAPRIGKARCARLIAFLGENPRVRDADAAAFIRDLPRTGDRALVERVKTQARRLEGLCPPPSADAASGREGSDKALGAPSQEEALGLVIASARPWWIARKRPGGASYQTIDGQGASLPSHSPLEGSPWLAIAEISREAGRADGLIRLAVPIREEVARTAGGGFLAEESRCSFEGGRLRSLRFTRLGAILLNEGVRTQPSIEDAARALDELLTSRGLAALDWSEGASSLRERLLALHEACSEPWPDVSDARLIADAREWLAPELPRLAGGAPLSSMRLEEALRALVPWPQAGMIDEWAPKSIEIPTGARRRIDWSNARPVLSLRVQEAFGWVDSPVFAGGRLPLILHLTDPAGRPAAVTSDLKSFWAGPYRDVRAQLRGRYPKHPWPENPFSEKPTSRAKPRR